LLENYAKTDILVLLGNGQLYTIQQNYDENNENQHVNLEFKRSPV